MINDGINNVPDKTIAVFTDPFNTSWQHDNKKRLFDMVDKPPKKRDWFTPHFYRCLPLTIGNQYGFIIKSEFDFSFIWDGGDSKDSIKLFLNESIENQEKPVNRSTSVERKATKNAKGQEKGIGTQAFAVRMRRIQNQTSTSQLAALLLLIPPNSGRPDFVCRFIRRRATELQN